MTSSCATRRCWPRAWSAPGPRWRCSTRDHDEEFGDVEGAAAEFAPPPPPDARRFVVPGRVRAPRGLAAAVQVRRAVRRFAPQVVHLQAGIGNDPRLLFAAGARPRRFALTVHDPVAAPRRRRLAQRHRRQPGAPAHRRSDLRPRRRAARRAGRGRRGHGRRSSSSPTALTPVRRGRYPSDRRFSSSAASATTRASTCYSTRWRLFGRSCRRPTLTVAGAGELGGPPGAGRSTRHGPRRVRAGRGDIGARLPPRRCVALPYRQASQSGVGSLAKRHGRPLVVSRVGGLHELVCRRLRTDRVGRGPGGAGAGAARRARRPRARRATWAGRPARRQPAVRTGARWLQPTLAAYEEHLLERAAGESG